jgi:hypothetical protein
MKYKRVRDATQFGIMIKSVECEMAGKKLDVLVLWTEREGQCAHTGTRRTGLYGRTTIDRRLRTKATKE